MESIVDGDEARQHEQCDDPQENECDHETGPFLSILFPEQPGGQTGWRRARGSQEAPVPDVAARRRLIRSTSAWMPVGCRCRMVPAAVVPAELRRDLCGASLRRDVGDGDAGARFQHRRGDVAEHAPRRGARPAAQAWIVAIYLLTLAVLLPVGGRLCDVPRRDHLRRRGPAGHPRPAACGRGRGAVAARHPPARRHPVGRNELRPHRPRRIGIRGAVALAIGLVCAAVGLAGHQVLVVCLALVPAGIGIGLLLSPMTDAALSAVPADRRGQASGLVWTVRQVGGSWASR